ncbi:MAG: NUDIX hydrolase [Bacteroidota bacterium]|nr:NUDIX hydrolase [Bacteroidota bacterium]
MNFKILNKEKLYQGRIVNLVVDTVEYDSGNHSVREVIEHPGGSVVLAVFGNRDILLVNQFRYPVQQHVLELPAGKLDGNEQPLHCAQRELREETGYEAKQWRKLTAIFTTPGFCDERLHIFMAQELSPSPDGQALEEGEQSLRVVHMPLDEALEKIEHNEIVDGKSIAGIMLGERLLRK